MKLMTKSSKITKRELSELEHFDAMAESYEQNYGYDKPFTKHKMNKKVKTMIDTIKNINESLLQPDKSWLEIGCGTGAYTRIVSAKIKAKIRATDISSAIIKVAKRMGKATNTTYSVASAYSLPYKDHSFDVVYGYYILHHLEQVTALKEALRVIKPGGILYFCEPNLLNPVVYAIKNVTFLKRLAGDSPDETAINPRVIEPTLSRSGATTIKYSEFLPSAIPGIEIKTMKKIDITIDNWISESVFKYLGGSIHIITVKSGNK